LGPSIGSISLQNILEHDFQSHSAYIVVSMALKYTELEAILNKLALLPFPENVTGTLT